MPKLFAHDRMPLESQRYIDANGFLHVKKSNISKEMVCPYHGSEVPGWEDMGLDPEHIYEAYRPARELLAAAESVNRLPILYEHHDIDAETPAKQETIGNMGSDGTFEAPYLTNSLVFTDGAVITAIQSGEIKELSLSYHYTPVLKAGVFQGQNYDFVMTNISGNHLALVPQGRAGADVCVADAAFPISKQITARINSMKPKLSRLVRAIRGLARDADPEHKDIEKAENELIDALKEVNVIEANSPKAQDADKDEEISRILELCAEGLSEEQLTTLRDALTALAYGGEADDACGKDEELKAEDEEKKAADEGEEKKAEDEDPDKAEDEDPREKMTPEEKTAFEEGVKYAENLLKKPGEVKKLDSERESEGATKAMDVALKRGGFVRAADLQAVYDAQNAVRPVVGDIRVNLARDSASSIYGKALDCMGINKNLYPRSAWRGIFETSRARTQGFSGARDAAISGVSKTDPYFGNLHTIKIKG